MAYQEFEEFPDLIKYYTTTGNGTLLTEEYTTIKENTLLKDIEHFLYVTRWYFSNNTPNQILDLMTTLILWSKTFYTTIGQYPTLYDFLAITRKDLIHWECHPDNPYTGPIPKVFRYTLELQPVYCGEVLHHMRDSIETYESSVCHSTNMTCPSVCQSHQLSICHTPNMMCPSICQSHQLSVHTTNMTRLYVCQSSQPSDHYTTTTKCLSVRQSNLMSDHHTNLTTIPSVCQSRQSSVSCTVELTRLSVCQRQYTSVCHTINITSLSICQTHEMSVRHVMKTKSPSICQPHVRFVYHTNIMKSPSVCPSKQSSDRHTTAKTSPSLSQSRILSVCHNIIQTSPSVCPTRDARHTVCSSSVMSVLPSANYMVKIPMSIPVRNFLQEQNPGKLSFVRTLQTRLTLNCLFSP